MPTKSHVWVIVIFPASLEPYPLWSHGVWISPSLPQLLRCSIQKGAKNPKENRPLGQLKLRMWGRMISAKMWKNYINVLIGVIDQLLIWKFQDSFHFKSWGICFHLFQKCQIFFDLQKDLLSSLWNSVEGWMPQKSCLSDTPRKHSWAGSGKNHPIEIRNMIWTKAPCILGSSRSFLEGCMKSSTMAVSHQPMVVPFI